jgi:hypothetical protein
MGTETSTASAQPAELKAKPSTAALADLKSHPYDVFAAMVGKNSVITTTDFMDGHTFRLSVAVHRNLAPDERELFKEHLPAQGGYVFVDMSRVRSPSCVKRIVICDSIDHVIEVDFSRFDPGAPKLSCPVRRLSTAEFMSGKDVANSLAELMK